jgi:antitoxin VapB
MDFFLICDMNFNMISLSEETEALARRIAAAQSRTVDETIRQALEHSVQAAGVGGQLDPRRRMTVEEMLAVGAEIAAMPLLDQRSPRQIMDDLNDL